MPILFPASIPRSISPWTTQARREKGIPRVDTHVYSRENGWVIQALAALYAVTGENEHLDDAVRAANWIIGRRSLPGGGFSHDEKDVAGPYLGDTLTMGGAFLALYAVTADPPGWIGRSPPRNSSTQNFKSDTGFSTLRSGQPRPTLQIDENTSLARFANLLESLFGQRRLSAKWRSMPCATWPLQGLAERRGFQVGGILLADRELSVPPLHITVVGGKNDPAARSLFLAALKQPATYKRVEWLDESEGPLRNADVEYPRDRQGRGISLHGPRAAPPPIFTPEKFKELR